MDKTWKVLPEKMRWDNVVLVSLLLLCSSKFDHSVALVCKLTTLAICCAAAVEWRMSYEVIVHKIDKSLHVNVKKKIWFDDFLFSYAAITIHVQDFRITKRPVWARVTQEVGQDVSGGALNSVGKGFSFAQTRPQMAEDQSIAIDRRWLRGNNFRKLKLYKMLSVRMQRCSRQEKGIGSIRVGWTENYNGPGM